MELKQAGDLPLKKNQTESDSPDLFKDIDLNVQPSSAGMSIIDLSISEEDVVSIDGSPTIKKRRKRYKVIPKPPAFTIISESEEKSVTPVNTTRENVKTNLFKPPVLKTDHDLSVIEGTPEENTKRSKTSSRVSNFVSKRRTKNRKSNNATLTQMFRTPVR